jgi:hypothetical protein
MLNASAGKEQTTNGGAATGSRIYEFKTVVPSAAQHQHRGGNQGSV